MNTIETYMAKLLTPEKIQRNKEAKFTSEEAESAIYIDFEGFEDKKPSMIGTLIGEKFEQVIFDETLRLAAEFNDLSFIPIELYLTTLRDKAVAEGRRIVAYSSHEKTMFQQHANLDISAQYADARLIAKVLRRKLEPDRPRPKALKEYFELIGYNRPAYLGERLTTSRIRAVADMLGKRKSFQSLTPVVKAKWTKLLQHNKHDVVGMRALIRAVVNAQ